MILKPKRRQTLQKLLNYLLLQKAPKSIRERKVSLWFQNIIFSQHHLWNYFILQKYGVGTIPTYCTLLTRWWGFGKTVSHERYSSYRRELPLFTVIRKDQRRNFFQILKSYEITFKLWALGSSPFNIQKKFKDLDFVLWMRRGKGGFLVTVKPQSHHPRSSWAVINVFL